MGTNVYINDTLIQIDIQAENKSEILTCVHDSMKYMTGWYFSAAAVMAYGHHPLARFFVFNLTQKVFDWWRTNDTYSDTMDSDEVVIKDLADISHLLDFVYQNADTLRVKPEPVWNPMSMWAAMDSVDGFWSKPKKKRKGEENADKLDMSKIQNMMAALLSKNDIKLATAPTYKWKDMPHFPTNMFYQDYANPYLSAGGKSLPYGATKMYMLKSKGDLDKDTAEAEAFKINGAKDESELVAIYNKLAGLHGPYAKQLKHMIEAKASAFKTHKKQAQLDKWKAEQELKAKKNKEISSWQQYKKSMEKEMQKVNETGIPKITASQINAASLPIAPQIKFLPYDAEDAKMWYKANAQAYKTYKNEYMSKWDNETDPDQL